MERIDRLARRLLIHTQRSQMKRLAAILALVILGISAGTMHADGIGVPVSGTLTFSNSGSTNFFNSANGFVPAGYGNSTTNGTVVIGAGTEFGFSNGNELITASFTGDTFSLTDNCVIAGCVNSPFELI